MNWRRRFEKWLFQERNFQRKLGKKNLKKSSYNEFVPQITSIKQQKGKKDRMNVYLDNKFGFGIDLDNFVLLNLRVEQELTDEEVEKIVKKAEFQKTLDKLLRFAMVRPRSEKEVKDYLYRKKVPDVIWKDLFSKLKSFELIDDEKFARWLVETRQNFSPKSRRILKQELQIKGIDRNIIDDVFSEVKIDEEKIALEMLKKKKFSDSQKMVQYLVRKGFDFEIAKRVAKSYNMEHV